MCVGPEIMLAMGMSASTAATASTVASVAMGAMSGLSAISSITQAKGQSNMAEYNAKMSERDAIIADQQKTFDLKAHQRQAARVKGAQRAAIAGSGGSLLDAGDIMSETSEELELDALAIKYGGKLAQDRAKQSSALSRMQGQSAKSAGYAQAGGTLLTGAKSGLALL